MILELLFSFKYVRRNDLNSSLYSIMQHHIKCILLLQKSQITPNECENKEIHSMKHYYQNT